MTPKRRRRINRLKKMIIYSVLLMIVIPVTGCIFLGIKLHRVNASEEQLMEQVRYLERALQESVDAADRAQALLEINEEIWRESAERTETETAFLEEVPEGAGDLSGGEAVPEDEGRKVYLTFDDGPSIYTEELLDILAEYDVKATFFVTGKDKEGYGDVYRRIVDEGHTLGMHSYSHEYSNIYASLENFRKDLEMLRDFLYDETGIVSCYYRFPGGSSNQVTQTDIRELTAYLNESGIRYFDWNVSAGDASSVPISSDEIVERVMSQLPPRRVAVVLMHDAKNKHSTLEALPKLIEEIRKMEDTELLPITEETMLIQHVSYEEDDAG